jgi:N6-L-threonylcarbamoyladenine synthase
MRVLGIESSCDETAASIIDDNRVILSNIVSSQISDHARFGGVVPEIAARAHLNQIELIVDMALKDASMTLNDVDAIAATCGPGLIGGVIVGMMAGKTMAAMANKPFIGVNHLEGHILSPRLSDDVQFPYLALLVSGAHTQILIAHDLGDYELLGTTLDDAVGECFDKVGRMLGLPFPGGKYVAQLAAQCDDLKSANAKYPLPRPLKGRTGCDFSFSGLKTAVMKYVTDDMIEADKVMLAASMENAVTDVMADRVAHGIEIFKSRYPQKHSHLVSGGGVAANETIKKQLVDLTSHYDMIFTAPPAHLCTDNGAMIAWAGLERFKAGLTSPLNTKPRPRWPLEELKKAIND